MINVIRADLFRILKSNVFWGIFIGMLIILALGNMMVINGDGRMTLISDTLNINEVVYSIQGSKIMPELLKGSNILMFFIIPIVLNVFISDFKLGTIKNTISYKYNRNIVYISKFILCSILSILMVMVYVLLGLFMNIAINGVDSGIYFSDFILTFKIIILQLPIYCGIVGVMFLIGIAFQSSIIVMCTMILYPFIVTVLAVVLKVVDISAFEPNTCLDKAAYMLTLNNNEILQIASVGFIMMTAAMSLGIVIFNKIDLK